MTSEFYDEAIRLPAVQTIETVKLLHEEIRHHFTRLGPVSVDASQVESIDAASLQLLVIAFISAGQVAKAIALHEPSPTFIAASRLLGVSRIFGLV
jgi:anti-anti-sigma regulatory factor